MTELKPVVTPAPESPEDSKTLVDHYRVLVAIGLGVVTLTMLQQGQAIPAVFLVVFALVMVWFRFRLSPMWLLVPIFIGESAQWWGFTGKDLQPPRLLQVDDLLRVGGALLAISGLYRLQGFWFGVFSPDPRLSGSKPAKTPSLVLRPADSFSPFELVLFLIEIALIVVVGQTASGWLFQPRRALGLNPRWIAAALIVWVMGVGILLVASLLRIYRQRTMSPALARLALQDDLWAQTRGEQRRNNRWLVWRRLKQEP